MSPRGGCNVGSTTGAAATTTGAAAGGGGDAGFASSMRIVKRFSIGGVGIWISGGRMFGNGIGRGASTGRGGCWTITTSIAWAACVISRHALAVASATTTPACRPAMTRKAAERPALRFRVPLYMSLQMRRIRN